MISVIITTYNREKLLKRAIESVLKQTFQDFELIVVDDGSTDNTKKVVSGYKEVKYVYQENSGGAARPKNTGIKMAQGKYIAILDSDDEWLPTKLEKQRELLESSNFDVVGCNILVDGKVKYRIPKYRNLFERMLVTDDMGTGSALIYKKEVFDKVGLFDENLKSGQDKEMRIRLAREYRFGFIDEYLVNYHLGSDNISNLGLNIEEREKDWEYIFKKYEKYYTGRLLSEKLRYDGTRYMLLGLGAKGRKAFLSSIVQNPFGLKNKLYFFVSWFGVNVYKYLANIKLWLR